MLEFEKVIERIKDILSTEIGERKVYDKDVAKALGLTPENFSMLKRRKRLPLKELLDFCAKRSININWLLYDQNPDSLETEKFIYVNYFKEIHGSAGGGAFNYDESVEKLYLDRRVVQMLGGQKRLKYIEAINVLGDSMEPLLKDGCIAFVDRSKRDITFGGIYLINTSVGFFIKRVQLLLDGRVELLSANPNYKPEVMLADEIEILGQIVGTIEKV